MAQIEVKNLSFKYPLGKTEALKNISLTIKDGEYIVICGKSGCGKTTLLRQIKSVLAPKGKKSGSVLIDGVDVSSLGVTEQAQKIGFVMQDPENQIVTDKVWHELAFGLENIGLKRDEIRLRTAEMASYFGIGSWFDRDVSTLSGGQKQLVNLAAVMAMRPEVLILDEPTSQLDPVAADNFLSVINKIKNAVSCVSILITWSLENAVETSDSMKARGFGGKRRTSYSRFVFTRQDLLLIVFIAAADITVAFAALTGGLYCSYNPYVMINPPAQFSVTYILTDINAVINPFTPSGIAAAAAYFLLCAM
ncbi:MAG: ATP-binding cassette domain-containing protein, partial [Acutalibacteraceae bacterium]